MVRKKLPHKSLIQRAQTIYERGVNKNTPIRLEPDKQLRKIADGNGLYLLVQRSKLTGNLGYSWVFRGSFNGKILDLGLGSFPATSLATGREKVTAIKDLIAKDIDPRLQQPRKAKQAKEEERQTLRAITTACWNDYKEQWTEKHRKQWISSLQPILASRLNGSKKELGSLRISEISKEHLVQAFNPCWKSTRETGERTLGRMVLVFEWARNHNLLEGDLPTAGVKDMLKKKHKKKILTHFRFIPWSQVPKFLQRLRTLDSNTSVFLPLLWEWQILTGVRSKEGRQATWSEIDLKQKRWNIPRGRMKNASTVPESFHRIPLVGRTLEILKELKKLPNDSEVYLDKNGLPVEKGSKAHKITTQYLFPGPVVQGRTQAFSENALLLLRDRMGLRDATTIHGFRTSFRIWQDEFEMSSKNPNKGNGSHVWSIEAKEASLSHFPSFASVLGSYARSSHFEPRIHLMDQWAHYCVPQKRKKR